MYSAGEDMHVKKHEGWRARVPINRNGRNCLGASSHIGNRWSFLGRHKIILDDALCSC